MRGAPPARRRAFFSALKTQRLGRLERYDRKSRCQPSFRLCPRQYIRPNSRRPAGAVPHSLCAVIARSEATRQSMRPPATFPASRRSHDDRWLRFARNDGSPQAQNASNRLSVRQTYILTRFLADRQQHAKDSAVRLVRRSARQAELDDDEASRKNYRGPKFIASIH